MEAKNQSCSMMMDVTVIIPVFNRPSIVIDAVRTAANQTLRPRQIIIVDDGSTDQTAATVQNWIDQNGSLFFDSPERSLRLVRLPKTSAAAARQFALENSGPSEYVCFLDSDDLWPEDFLERAAAVMNENSAVVAASADRRFVDASETVFKQDDCNDLSRSPIEWIFAHGGGIASCSVFRREIVDAAGGWITTLQRGEDGLLFCKLATHGHWCHLPGAPVTFRHGIAQGRKEESNLSLKFIDALEQWAIAFEHIYRVLSDANVRLNRTKLRHYIASYWYRAGKKARDRNDGAKAKSCFDKALSWNPMMVRPRIALLRSRQ